MILLFRLLYILNEYMKHNIYECISKRVQDIWEYKDPQYPSYPTEKNSEVPDLIIKTSSNENSLVLDCFCGSGTTLFSAQKLNRKWIGIDQSTHAIKATKEKIKQIESDLFIPDNSFEFTNLMKKQKHDYSTLHTQGTLYAQR